MPAQVWHLTHRCHHHRFSLQFARDRRRWRAWLDEARRRFGLVVLDYTATSNHVHLSVRDQGRREIAASMQLIEGCTGQASNRRKRRGGAVWEDQYHGAAVETGAHLARIAPHPQKNIWRIEHRPVTTVPSKHKTRLRKLGYLQRPLGELDLRAIAIDGIVFRDHTVKRRGVCLSIRVQG